MRPVRWLGLVLVLLLVAGACGQKENVALSAGGGPGLGTGGVVGDGAVTDDLGAVEGTTAGVDDATGTGATGAAGTGTGAVAGTTGGATSGGRPVAGSAGATATTARAGSSTPSGATAAPTPGVGPNDKNGVTAKEIVIGIHAPVTGAAPFPQSTFEEGREVYWKAKGPIHGRTVKVLFFDDQFNPSRAVQVCRELVEKNKVFILVGGGGADQISACAKYANQVGVPYLSAGVNQSGLEKLRTYFALSLTYSQQSPILAGLAKNKLGKSKIGILVADTPSFADAQASFTKASQDVGLEIVRNAKISKSATQSEILSAAGDMQRSGAEIVYILTSPTVFIQFAQAAEGQQYRPQYIGPGITSGLNTVAAAGCGGIGEARFLSPFFQLDDPGANEYKDAYRKQWNKEGDDIGFALWGLNAFLGDIFQATGPDLGRAKFMATLNSGQAFGGGVYPPAKFAPGKPFGGSAAHLLKADCNAKPPRYITEAKNVTGF